MEQKHIGLIINLFFPNLNLIKTFFTYHYQPCLQIFLIEGLSLE